LLDFLINENEGWQESKVGRVFKAIPRQPKCDNLSWEMIHSEYIGAVHILDFFHVCEKLAKIAP